MPLLDTHNSKRWYDVIWFFQHIFRFSTLRIFYIKIATSERKRGGVCISLVGTGPSITYWKCIQFCEAAVSRLTLYPLEVGRLEIRFSLTVVEDSGVTPKLKRMLKLICIFLISICIVDFHISYPLISIAFRCMSRSKFQCNFLSIYICYFSTMFHWYFF